MTTSSILPKTIILKGSPPVFEALSADSSNIKPGMLLELTSAGTVRPHQTAPIGPAAPFFAIEAGYVGGDIDDVYTNGGTVTYITAQPGDEVYAILADDENVAIGAYLQSNGDGSLEAVDSDGHGVAIALEAVNTTGGAAATSRIKVRVV